ncbi:MAG: transposase [Planctomycetes bacterium]|nr:transposase [Planctomycetota bacterium]
MSHTYTKLLTHILFSTKNREPLIATPVQPQLHAYIGGIVRDLGGSALTVGGVADHIHFLVLMPPRIALSDALREIKSGSSRWMKDGQVPNFAWQTGFAAFSVSQTRVPETLRYIETQAEHHKVKSFQEELLEFLKGYEVEYDERYLWD